MDFLRKKGISTVESLDTRLDEIGQTAVSVMGSMKKSEKRIKAINTMLSYICLLYTSLRDILKMGGTEVCGKAPSISMTRSAITFYPL